jgi:RHH-type rel operon transcriptional repressor/antitoxin RelB
MPSTITVRLPDEINENLETLAEGMKRTKSYLVKSAVEQYIAEYADYQIALDRLNDKDDAIIDAEEMRKRLDRKTRL